MMGSFRRRFSNLGISFSMALMLVLTLVVVGDKKYYAEAFSVQTGTAAVETTVNELLSQAPDYAPSPDDDFFRKIRARVPCQIQYFLRDSGVNRLLVDTMTWLAAPAILEEHPTALTRFLHLSGLPKGSLISKLVSRQLKTIADVSEDDLEAANINSTISFQRLNYGSHRKQVLDVIHHEKGDNNKAEESRGSKRLVLFVHGGAWGSGFPAIYRLTAGPFLEQKMDVAFLGYRTYPDGNIPDQSEDIIAALSKLEQEGLIDSQTDITLMGHSSGAHISAVALLSSQGFRQRIGSFVAMSGVYDVPKHYLYEKARGVERFSPMAVATISSDEEEQSSSSFDRTQRSLLQEWKSLSPTLLLRQQQSDGSSSLVDFFPDTLILHGQNDTTVPMESSVRLWEALQSSASQETNNRIDLAILPEVEHAEVITQIMFDGITKDTVLNWMMEQGE